MIDLKFNSKMVAIPAHFENDLRTLPPPRRAETTTSGSGNNIKVEVTSPVRPVSAPSPAALFSELVDVIHRGVPGLRGASLISAVHDMEKTQGTHEFASAYRRFASLSADHQALVLRFQPALSTLLKARST
ncbi:MAG: hypothetical protein ACK5IB_11545 [Qingshengfaniella sp.]